MVPVRAHAKQLHVNEKNLYVGHWMRVKKAIKTGTAKVKIFVFDNGLVLKLISHAFAST